MKNIKIFPKDWLLLHPYKQSTPVDSYYAGLANRIYDIFVQTKLINSFEEDETKQVCMRMAAYFEDVISGLNIWRSFITAYKELYGKYLPFYTPDEYYYEDEANLEDVRFLIWHYTQQYHGERKGTFVNPDNPAQETTACLVYQLFCDEWTTAPENERMQALFSPETRYDIQGKYEDLLYWFHYQLYLYPHAHDKFVSLAKAYLTEHPDADKGQVMMSIYESSAYVEPTPFLAWTSPEWLVRIIPADHPDYAFFEEKAVKGRQLIRRETNREEARENNEEAYRKFREASEDRPLLYFSNFSEVENFFKEKIGLEQKEYPSFFKDKSKRMIALYATPVEGIDLLLRDVEAIKDENNPFYDQAKAEKTALSFFIVDHVNIYFLKELVERGMLADAQTTSLISPERGKAIMQYNWEFLSRYFLQTYPDE